MKIINYTSNEHVAQINIASKMNIFDVSGHEQYN